MLGIDCGHANYLQTALDTSCGNVNYSPRALDIGCGTMSNYPPQALYIDYYRQMALVRVTDSHKAAIIYFLNLVMPRGSLPDGSSQLLIDVLLVETQLVEHADQKPVFFLDEILPLVRSVRYPQLMEWRSIPRHL